MSPLHLLSSVFPAGSLSPASCPGTENESSETEFVFTNQQTVKGSDFPFHFRSSFQSHTGCVCFSISKPQEESSSITQLFIKITLLPHCMPSTLFQCWRWQGDFQAVMYLSDLYLSRAQSLSRSCLFFKSCVMFDY